MGGRQLPGRRPVAGPRRMPGIASGSMRPSPTATSVPDEGPDHLVAEGVGPEPELEPLGLAVHGQPLQAPDRGAPAAGCRQNEREVVLAHQVPGGRPASARSVAARPGRCQTKRARNGSATVPSSMR